MATATATDHTHEHDVIVVVAVVGDGGVAPLLAGLGRFLLPLAVRSGMLPDGGRWVGHRGRLVRRSQGLEDDAEQVLTAPVAAETDLLFPHTAPPHRVAHRRVPFHTGSKGDASMSLRSPVPSSMLATD